MKNCLTTEHVMLAAWRLDDDDVNVAHLETCEACRERVEQLRAAPASIDQRTGGDDARLAAGRRRLMDAIGAQIETRSDSVLQTLGAFVMRHRTSLSTAGAVSLVVLLVWSFSGSPSIVMAQATKAIREATSYRFEMLMEVQQPKKSTTKGVAYWSAPGSYRMEMVDRNQVDIKFRDKPGLGLDHTKKQYWAIPAQAGQVPSLMLLHQLGKYSGEADRQLGEKKIDGVAAQGFEIAAKKIDSGVPQGDVVIWIDKKTHLPVLVEHKMDLGEATVKLTMSKFAWNTKLDASLFDTTPPDGYTERKRAAFTIADQTEKIVAGLKLYAKAFDGEFPRGKMVYGDVTSNALRKKLGITRETPTNTDEFAEFLEAQHGFAYINMILRDNADAAWFGKMVTAKDEDQLLLYWRTEGGYQVIFGSLESKKVSADELKKIKP